MIYSLPSDYDLTFEKRNSFPRKILKLLHIIIQHNIKEFDYRGSRNIWVSLEKEENSLL